MRLIPLLMLACASCSSAGEPASRPVTPAPASQPASAPTVVLPAPASRPAVYPSLSGEQVRLLLAGVELEKGDLAADRDRWKERSKLAELYGEREAAELRTSRVVAWCVGGAVAVAAAIAGFVAGEAAAGKFAAPVTR